jgi:hypothetical protein
MQNANAKELVKRVAMFEKAFDVVLQIWQASHFMRGRVLSKVLSKDFKTC